MDTCRQESRMEIVTLVRPTEGSLFHISFHPLATLTDKRDEFYCPHFTDEEQMLRKVEWLTWPLGNAGMVGMGWEVMWIEYLPCTRDSAGHFTYHLCFILTQHHHLLAAAQKTDG